MTGLLLRTPLLCGLILLVQGFVTYGIGYVAPLLQADLAIRATQMGLVFGATVVGALIGATVIAPLSDRIGRRPVLLLAVVTSGLASLLMPLAGGVAMLVIGRGLIGAAMGASLPVAAALVSESVPASRRALMVTMASSAMVIGMGISGLTAGVVVSAGGWRAMHVMAGMLALVAGGLCCALLAPAEPAAAAARAAGAPPRQLLSPLLRRPTLLLAVGMTMPYFVMNFTTYWLPTLLMGNGLPVGEAGLVGGGRQMASVAMGVIIGWWMDRLGTARVLVVVNGTAAVLFFGVVMAAGLPALALLLTGITLLSAALSGFMALVSGTYASALRASALGWIQGSARLVGGLAGTWAVGLLIEAGWGQAALAALMGAVTVISVVALLLLPRGAGPAPGHGPAGSPVLH